jgi:hypothetical protein
MWKAVRVVILLLILIKVIQMRVVEDAKLDWKKSFYVTVYPINADNSSVVSAYINTLTQKNFEEVPDYFATQAVQYQLPIRRPIEIQLGEEIKVKPPAPPLEGHWLEIIFWSLKFRMFAWLHNSNAAIKPDIQLYLLYYDPNQHPSLSHSTALQKGRIGRINLFGDKIYETQNLVILAHELLHTVKATDKYTIGNNFPNYPEGYAEPHKQPLHPQQFAELMGGRIPMTHDLALIPDGLAHTKMGEKTAKEIGWLK